MKAQNNPRKSKYCQWYRNKDGLNNLCAQLNERIAEFEKKHGVRVSIRQDLDRSLFFDKVFFEEIQQVKV